MNDSSTQLVRIFKCPENYRQILAGAGYWPTGAPKPPRPKEALGYLHRHHKVQAFNAEFGKLAEAMSVRKCQVPAFIQLRDQLARLVPGAVVKLADIHNPARFDWLADQGFRLDASPYLSGAYEARKLLERLPGTQPLHELVTGHGGRDLHAARSSAAWVLNDPEHGVPFMASTDMLEADFIEPAAVARESRRKQSSTILKSSLAGR